jgi:hypothetical protein
MSAIQKQMLLKLHKILVANNLFFAARCVLQVLIKNNIPTKLNHTILRIHLLSVFSIHSVEANFPEV